MLSRFDLLIVESAKNVNRPSKRFVESLKNNTAALWQIAIIIFTVNISKMPMGSYGWVSNRNYVVSRPTNRDGRKVLESKGED